MANAACGYPFREPIEGAVCLDSGRGGGFAASDAVPNVARRAI